MMCALESSGQSWSSDNVVVMLVVLEYGFL